MSRRNPPIVAAQSARFIAMPSAMSVRVALSNPRAASSEMPSASARRCPSFCVSGSPVSTSASGSCSSANVSSIVALEVVNPDFAPSVLLVGAPCGTMLMPRL